MNKIRCVIIDDEKHAISLLTSHISSMPNLELVKAFHNPLLALSQLSEEDHIDIIFLDVEMPHISGIDLAVKLRPKTRTIIFTSAYQQYAIDAFDVQASNYLLKPISLTKFTIAVAAVIEKELFQDKGSKNMAFFKTGEKGKLSRIRKHEIIYFEAAKNYVSMVTFEKKELVYLTMKEIEKAFCTELFCRVHRSHIINVKKIEKIVGNTINLGNGHQVQMGITYREKFLKFVAEKTLLTGRM